MLLEGIRERAIFFGFEMYVKFFITLFLSALFNSVLHTVNAHLKYS